MAKQMFVTVGTHPETGVVITPNPNKPDFGTIRLDQEVVTVRNNFINKSKRSVFVAGNIEVLKSLDYKAGQLIPGKIIMEESFEPFYDGQSPKINPTTKDVITKEGKPVYFQYILTEDMNATDTFKGSVEIAQPDVNEKEPEKIPEVDPAQAF